MTVRQISDAPPRPKAASTGHIPARAHFVWLGGAFPWTHVLAIRSAALRGGMSQVVLHHDCELARTPHVEELVGTPGVVLRRLHVPVLLSRCDPFAARLREAFDQLRELEARTRLVRLALLYAEGGVCLDMDTVTVRRITPLCGDVPAFCGEERVAAPARVRNAKDPFTVARATAQSLVGNLLSEAPRGWALFREIEAWYPRATSAAVFGAAARSRFITELLEHVLRMTPEQRRAPDALGSHLLQNTVARYADDDVRVHPPEMFSPLGPETSAHWFRPTLFMQLDHVVGDARVVHWHAKRRPNHATIAIDPAFVRRHAHSQLFCKLALPFVGG